MKRPRLIPITPAKYPARALVGRALAGDVQSRGRWTRILTLASLLAMPTLALAQSTSPTPPHPRTITDNTLQWPDADVLIRALSLRDYNTRVVVIGTMLLGAAAGVIGCFAYLRKRALLGDALSHATLPGIAAAFILAREKNLAILLLGATISGVLGVLAAIGLRRIPRIKEDAAIGTVLSVFFGAGMVLFSIVQGMNTGQEAGLQSFIYGKAAAMGVRDASLIGGAAAIVIAGSALLYKEFRLVCFDQAYAAAQGWPVFAIDVLMMALVVLTTVVGLQAVGLILVVALLIIPAAAARFWTDRLAAMTVLAGVFGAASGWLGSTVSAVVPRMPTGAIIVACAGVLFAVSMIVSPRRGLLAAALRHYTLARRVALQHLLRGLAESEESDGVGQGAPFSALLRSRSWSIGGLRKLVARCHRRGLLTVDTDGSLRLTDHGRAEARRVLRNHRLWEMYLIRYADIAPSHVDRDADELEHVLPETIVRELERAVAAAAAIPASPHPPGAHA